MSMRSIPHVSRGQGLLITVWGVREGASRRKWEATGDGARAQRNRRR